MKNFLKGKYDSGSDWKDQYKEPYYVEIAYLYKSAAPLYLVLVSL